MANIDPPVMPIRLYRYRDTTSMQLARRELSAIQSNMLWFSPYRALNDPMEGIFGASPALARRTNFRLLSRDILNEKRSVGICCFSDTYENELMWAHYAGNYGGICVEYSTNDLRTGLSDHVHIVRVAYNNDPPRIGTDYSKKPDHAARTVLSHKKHCWQYEREWRLLVGADVVKIPGPITIGARSPIKAVYLGSRIETHVKDLLCEQLSRSRIKVHTMKVSGYEHTWSQL